MKKLWVIIFLSCFSLQGTVENSLFAFASSLESLKNALSGGVVTKSKKDQFDEFVQSFKTSGVSYKLVDDLAHLYLGSDYTNLSDDDRADYDYWKERLWLEYFDKNYSQLDPESLVKKVQQDDDKDIDLFLMEINLNNILTEYSDHLNEYADNMLQDDQEAQARYQKFSDTYTNLYYANSYLEIMKLILSRFNSRGEYIGIGNKPFSNKQMNEYVTGLQNLKSLYPSSNFKNYEDKIGMLQAALGTTPTQPTPAEQQIISNEEKSLKDEIDVQLQAYLNDKNAYLAQDKKFLVGVRDKLALYIDQIGSPGPQFAQFRARLDTALPK